RLDYGNDELVKMIREIDLGILSTSMFPHGLEKRLLWAAKCNTLLAMADDLFAEQSIASLRRLSNDPHIARGLPGPAHPGRLEPRLRGGAARGRAFVAADSPLGP